MNTITLTFTTVEGFNKGRTSEKVTYSCDIGVNELSFYKSVDGNKVPIKRRTVPDGIIESWQTRLEQYVDKLDVEK